MAVLVAVALLGSVLGGAGAAPAAAATQVGWSGTIVATETDVHTGPTVEGITEQWVMRTRVEYTVTAAGLDVDASSTTLPFPRFVQNVTWTSQTSGSGTQFCGMDPFNVPRFASIGFGGTGSGTGRAGVSYSGSPDPPTYGLSAAVGAGQSMGSTITGCTPSSSDSGIVVPTAVAPMPGDEPLVDSSFYTHIEGSAAKTGDTPNDVVTQATLWNLTRVDVRSADLSLTLVASPNPIQSNAFLQQTATVTNLGPDPAEEVALDLTPPLETTAAGVFDITPSAGTCQRHAERLTCSLPNLPVGTTWTVTVMTRIPLAFPGPGPLLVLARAASLTPDPVPANNGGLVEVAWQGGVCERSEIRARSRGPAGVVVDADVMHVDVGFTWCHGQGTSPAAREPISVIATSPVNATTVALAVAGISFEPTSTTGAAGTVVTASARFNMNVDLLQLLTLIPGGGGLTAKALVRTLEREWPTLTTAARLRALAALARLRPALDAAVGLLPSPQVRKLVREAMAFVFGELLVRVANLGRFTTTVPIPSWRPDISAALADNGTVSPIFRDRGAFLFGAHFL